ncbi:MAG TPA: universal stress protein [Acidobacteriota bacterium]|nr:universal stress protein [Acidobacteriota bacterium]
MIAINKILFPTDFSECADHALVWAIMLAKNFEAELTMLHAVVLHGDDVGDEVYSRFPDLDRVVQTLIENADTRLETSIPDKGEVEIRQVVKRGVSASDEILNFIEKEGIDLITIGTHGRTGLGRFLMGSVADRVIRHCNCPVLVVRCGDGPPPERVDIQSVMLPIDFSDHSKHAARYAVALAGAVDAELRVVHVIDQSVHPSFYAIGKESLLELDPELESRAEAAIDEFMRDAGCDVPYSKVIAEGKPATEIARLSKEGKDCLIVIASHGAGGLERIMIGSTTEKVVHMTDCPVMIVKRNPTK